MSRLLYSLTLLLAILVLAQARPCDAEWTKDITCPASTIYRDLRPYAGREEFCERLLPGSLRVKDGPFRSWFSEGHPGDRGSYKNGRQVGLWIECDRFDRCKHAEYELSYPSEKERPGFRPEVPVSYQHGKYVFDFASCWSTWVNRSGDEDLNLNINGSGNRCDVAYIPQHVMDHGGEGDYFCSIPFSVGERDLDSLDLMRELPKLGLPQFCYPISRTGATLILVDKKFMTVATTEDVQCAALGRDSSGLQILTFTLNRYVADLATEIAAKRGPLIGRLCITGGDQTTSISQDAAGQTQFSFRLSDVPADAKKQGQCIAVAIKLKASCF
jgi:hypothetical protein